MKLIVATLLAAATVSAAHAQTVYRCGNAYSQSPCPQAKRVDVSDERSATQQAEARRVAVDERRMADEMRRERLADEHATRATMAASLSGSVQTELAAAPQAQHKKKHRFGKAPRASADFVAYDPRSRPRRNGGG